MKKDESDLRIMEEKERKELQDRYIRFDWAIKRLLRQKANFDVLDGFLTVMLGEEIKIVEILESEGNQESADDKFNRVDIKALNSKGEIIIVEIQNTREIHYLERILYGVAKAITEHISLGEGYQQVKKVYSISILYFDIGVAFTGVDHVDLDAARECGVKVSNAAGYSTQAVAELALCMMLSLLRNVPQVAGRCRQGKTKDGLVGCELRGKTVGIVGAGAIGTRTAELCKAFGCRVLGNKRHLTGKEPSFIEFMPLEELLSQSDIVSLHCPLTAETRQLINADRLGMMKQGAYLINTARGGVVDSAALAEALKNGYLAGAGIDVFETEPPLDPAHPLLQAPNVLATPHVAFASEESMEARAAIVFSNLSNWMDGKQENVIL